MSAGLCVSECESECEYTCVCVCVCKWNVLVGVLCACGKASVTMGSDTPKWPKRVSPNPRLSATINVHLHRFLTLGKYGDCVCFVLSFFRTTFLNLQKLQTSYIVFIYNIFNYLKEKCTRTCCTQICPSAFIFVLTRVCIAKTVVIGRERGTMDSIYFILHPWHSVTW